MRMEKSSQILFFCLVLLGLMSIGGENTTNTNPVQSRQGAPRRLGPLTPASFHHHRQTKNANTGQHYNGATGPHGWNKKVHPKKRDGSSKNFSSSLFALEGYLRIKVIGTGDACLQNIEHSQKSYEEEFGLSTSSSAFIELFGIGKCEEGAIGHAFGYVRACVIAEAYEKSDNCLVSVVCDVLTHTHDPDPDDGVSVHVHGSATGEALALC